MTPTQPSTEPAAAPVPRSFGEYVRSFGPGIVIVLTWLGAGDVVDMAVAGSSFGYALMWMLVIAVLMRFFFVSLIAKYQLCNQHGEGVLDGLARIHPWAAPLLLILTIVMGHAYQAYMVVGTGEISRNMTGVGETWQWALAWYALALVLVFQPAYRRLELVFLFFLAVLSVSFIGSAIWVGFNPVGIVEGLYRLEMPEHAGKPYNPLLVAVAMIGAIMGSIMNLAYPYFLEAKGWRGTQYRRVQTYDLLVGVTVMVVLNLAVWTMAAELLYPHQEIKETDDLPKLLSTVLGPGGRLLFYCGIFAAVYTSVIGHAAGLAYMGSHAYLRWQAGTGPVTGNYRQHPLYRWIVVWCLVSPLVWVIPGMPGFITLTLVMNCAQVVLLPLLAGGVWLITASERYIGAEYRNRWWENLAMTIWLGFAFYGAVHAVQLTIDTIQKLVAGQG